MDVKIKFEYEGKRYGVNAKVRYVGGGEYELTNHKCNEDADIEFFPEDGYWALTFYVDDEIVEAQFTGDTLALKNVVLWRNDIIAAELGEFEKFKYNGEMK